MSEWQQKWPEARPRWGTFSVRAHTSLTELIADVLMYDVLVFPCPDSEQDFIRWERQGWDPELLALRVVQLGDAAVTIPWDHELRTRWRDAFLALPETAREDPSRAFLLTSEHLADLPFSKLMGADDDRLGEAAINPPEIHPAFAASDARRRAGGEDLELIAAFQHGGESVMFTGSSASADLGSLNDWSSTAALRVQLPLAVPESADEQMFHRTLDVIRDADFLHARRRLWSWESQLPDNAGPDDVRLCLETLLADYNRTVERQLKRTRLETVFLLLPAVAGILLDQLLGGWLLNVAGVGSGLAIQGVKARFPLLKGEAVRASHHPGSAVSGMVSIVGQG